VILSYVKPLFLEYMTSLNEIRPKDEDILELTPDMEEELNEKEVSSQELRVYDSDLEESDSIPGRHNGHNSKVCHCSSFKYCEIL
jgi:hypothetical protein